MSDGSSGRRRFASSGVPIWSKNLVNSLARLTVAIVLFPPRSMTETAGAVVVLTLAGLGAQTPPTLGSVPDVATHLPPFCPHTASATQVVLQVPATKPTHDPAAMPGQSASTLQAVVAEPAQAPATRPPQEPVAAPGQFASTLQAAAGGPAKIPIGDLGDAHTDATYPKPPWMLIVRSWFGKHPAVPPL